MTEAEKALIELPQLRDGESMQDYDTRVGSWTLQHFEKIRKSLQGVAKLAHLDDALSVAHDEIRVLKDKTQGLLKSMGSISAQKTSEEMTGDTDFYDADGEFQGCWETGFNALVNIAREAMKNFNSDETGVGS